MRIWIVHGSTGEYSDRGEWVVDAHRTEEAAQARVKALEAKLHASGIERMTRWDDDWLAAKQAFQSDPDGDPNFDIDYTGTSWYLSPCELRD
jgi:hypothetical protein